MKKKFLAVLLAGAMVLGVTAVRTDLNPQQRQQRKKKQQPSHLQLQLVLKNATQRN